MQILWGLPCRIPLGEDILDVLLPQKVLDVMEKHVGGGIHLWDRSLLLSFPSLLLGVDVGIGVGVGRTGGSSY
jgi:hypothetical protein